MLLLGLVVGGFIGAFATLAWVGFASADERPIL
jgi:hypothetical protein